MNQLKISAVIFSTLLVGSCCKEYPWEGLVYPKTGQMPYDIAIGHFATLEECRASALAVLSKTHPESGATPDYECGYKCKISDQLPPPGQLALRTCEKTEK
jgi:hypothetical protein